MSLTNDVIPASQGPENLERHPAHQVGSLPLRDAISTHFPVLISKRFHNRGKTTTKEGDFLNGI